MSKNLGLRILKRKKLFKNIYSYLVKINLQPFNNRSIYTKKRNKEEFDEIISLLHQSGVGKYTFRKTKHGFFKEIYLKEKSDLMLVKMCYSKYIFRIYELKGSLK
jgi:hypothetical protein